MARIPKLIRGSSLPISRSQLAVLLVLSYLATVRIVYMIRSSFLVPWDQFSREYEQKRGHSPPPLMSYWLDHAQRNSCPLDQYEAVYTDLERFRHSGLTESDVLLAMSSCPTCRLIKVENGQLFIDGKKESRGPFSWILGPALKTPGLRFSMAVNFDDRPELLRSDDPSNNKPIFSWCVHKDGRDGDIRVPYAHGVFQWTADDEIIWGVPDWTTRREALVWRGTTTGTEIRPGIDWRNTHRFQMAAKLARPGTMIGGVPADVGFTEILQCEDETECETAKREFDFAMRKRVRFGWFAYQKYTLDIDGNSFSNRFAPLLRSGTVVLKAGQYNQWYSERVSPWEHYIPVDITLNDLDGKIAWAIQNPAKAKAMSVRAAETAAKSLRDADSRCYAYRLIIEYASLFHETSTA